MDTVDDFEVNVKVINTSGIYLPSPGQNLSLKRHQNEKDM